MRGARSDIPAEAASRIFEPLFRASTRPGGYGLGLATVKRLVESHGGSVDVESAPGQGTTVAIHLPVAPHVRAIRARL
jgi:signal transduction histidine kinase